MGITFTSTLPASASLAAGIASADSSTMPGPSRRDVLCTLRAVGAAALRLIVAVLILWLALSIGASSSTGRTLATFSETETARIVAGLSDYGSA